ncbi:MFS transporter-like protein 3 [Elsinoe australis]|uniref:MFS transporter-like protein 3 n=1 Tax=Elsinoe australis TaxID=40998 RepID=A0A4U7BBH4_9PEZI|nr:MFS transporter-like protein 3 [Elsinoe australis]
MAAQPESGTAEVGPADQEEVELLRLRTNEPDTDTDHQSSLPRADGGRDAWLVLLSCFVLEAIVWGFPFAYGVFNDYYNNYPLFKDNESSIAAVGTTSTGIMYFSAPLVYATARRYPFIRKPMNVVGCSIMILALIAASYAKSASHLLATQGIMYGIGGSLAYFTAFIYLDEWFIARKGLAYGMLWTGTGTGGFALPFVMEWALRDYGFRTTLRIWAIVTLVVLAPAIWFLKGRLPIQHSSTGPQRVEIGFLRGPAFWIFILANTIQSLGYFLPTVYMPAFARAVGMPSISGTVAVSLTNGSTVLGLLAFGYLSDHTHVTTTMNICALGTVLSVFLFWGFAVYAPLLYIFAVLYGVFAGGYSACWAGVSGPLKSKWPLTETGMIVSLLSVSRGLGSVISGPLSGVLVQADSWAGADFAWGSGYGSVIAFSGLTAAATTLGWCGKKARLL